MNKKKYIIYLDILGFKVLAVEMTEGTIFEEDRIRQEYLSDPLKEKIEEIKREGIEISKGISEVEGSDNYVLIVDDIQTAFELVGELTTIKIPHKDHEFIPLEVALGTEKIDEDIEVLPINRKEIIKFLNDRIINPYRSYYKNKNNETIKRTFVLSTQAFFDDLEPLDKKYCEQISYRNKTFFVADLEKIRQRARVFQFLEKIGWPGSNLYGRIDEVYVPPSEYEEMVRALEEKRILFVTGTPEYGKTYTAVRLMWEFYNRGYEPRWIMGRELPERIEVRRKLEDIGTMLKPGHIIYFEDLFGTTRYEGREGLEREIGTIIDSVRQVEDVYVIITSREEVFKEFEKEKLSAAELQEFEKKLNIKKPSYDYEKRKEILLKWAVEKNCKWLGTKKLKGLVLESIKDEKTLPTPLSIRDFDRATFDVEDEDELRGEIKEKSVETAKAFAKEIKDMSDDKILFLSFLFITGYFEVEFVKATYQELVEELNLKDAWGFDRILNWFKDDKISIIDKYIGFPHPSYSEALEHLLGEDRYPTRINREIFSKLLLRLSEKDETAGSFVWAVLAVADTFDELSEIRFSTLDGRSWAASDNFDEPLICREDEDHRCFHGVPWTVARNFDKLPEGVRNLLFELSEKDEGVWAVANAVSCNFDKFPDDVRNNLVLKISEKNWTGFDIPMAIGPNFDKLPDDVRNEFMLKLSEKDDIFWSVANVVAGNFDKNPEYIKSVLYSERDETVWAVTKAVAFALAYNFDKLPENVKNLLDRLQNPLQQVIEDLTRKNCLQALDFISKTFSTIDSDFASKILNELSESGDETVRTEASKLLKTISDDSDGDE